MSDTLNYDNDELVTADGMDADDERPVYDVIIGTFRNSRKNEETAENEWID